MKALVGVGADITIKNNAGLDAVFLAERTAWSNGEIKEGEDEAGEGEAEVEVEGQADAGEGENKAGPGRQVVEWLLSSDKGGELESGVAEGSGANEGEAKEVNEKK